MTNVEANGNLEEGIDFEEDDDLQDGGDMIATRSGHRGREHGGDAGLKIRERGRGSIEA